MAWVGRNNFPILLQNFEFNLFELENNLGEILKTKIVKVNEISSKVVIFRR